jgi:uncharacterized protein
METVRWRTRRRWRGPPGPATLPGVPTTSYPAEVIAPPKKAPVPEQPSSRPSTPPPPVPPPGAGGADASVGEADPSAGERAGQAGPSVGDHDLPPPPPPPWSARTRAPATGTPQPSASGALRGHHGDATPPAPGLDDRERTLDPRVVHVWRIMTAIGLTIPLVPASVLAMVLLGRLGGVVPVVAVVLLVVYAGWYPRARWDRWRWRLTPRALELSYGVLVHTQEAVPYFRIQQIDVTQGPLDRLLDLATLQVTTAAASGSASLPGVPADQAPMVRAELLARASQAVSEHEGDVRDAV